MTEEKRRKPGASLEDGEELRGFQFKVYPTQEQSKKLFRWQKEVRCIWNLLCDDREAHLQRMVDAAVFYGLVADPGERPDKKAPRAEWKAWLKARKGAEIAGQKLAKDHDSLKWPPLTLHAHVYKPLIQRAEEQLGVPLTLSIKMVRAVITRFSASRIPKKTPTWRPPKRKREVKPWHDYTMIQVRESTRLVVEPGERWGFFKFEGELFKIRVWRPFPSDRMCDGGAIVRKADGWYGSVRFKAFREKRYEDAVKGTFVALSFGSEAHLLTTHDKASWPNPRGNEYSKLVAHLDDKASEAGEDEWKKSLIECSRQRLMLRARRQTQYSVYARIIPYLAEFETIVVGTVSRNERIQAHMPLTGDDDGGGVQFAGEIIEAIKYKLPGRLVQVDVESVDDSDPVGTAREVLAKWRQLQGEVE